jgi:hypothetical protein
MHRGIATVVVEREVRVGDKNKSGELDAKELAQSTLWARPFAAVGK